MTILGFDLPIYAGTTLLCEACCPEGYLECDEGSVYFICPHHMRIRFDDGKITEVQSVGLRQ